MSGRHHKCSRCPCAYQQQPTTIVRMNAVLYHVLKKRKKTPNTCSHALSPPLGIDEILLTEALVVFFSSFALSNSSSASAAFSIGSSAGPWIDSVAEFNSTSLYSSMCEPVSVSLGIEDMMN